MDRNYADRRDRDELRGVASREGGVDRNRMVRIRLSVCWAVASREGGVDRNQLALSQSHREVRSPPARGAWIATPRIRNVSKSPTVASREGGVDRNTSIGACRAGR